MTNDETLADFFGSLDVLRFPQTLVTEVTDAEAVNLNNWRKNSVIPGFYWERKGQVLYTGRGLLFVGLLNRLSPFLGPAKASELILGIVDQFDQFENVRGKVLTIPHQKGGVGPAYAVIAPDEISYNNVSGSQIIVPIGDDFYWWAGIATRMFHKLGKG